MQRLATNHDEPARASSSDADRTALLACLVDSAEDAIFSTTLEGLITSWNAAAEAIYGYVAWEVMGKRMSLIKTGARQQDEEEMLARIREGGRVEHLESLHVCKDGGTRMMSLTVSPVRDGSGKVVGLSVIGHDISQRKRAEERAGDASQYARSLIEASADPLLTISPDGKITDVNDGTVKVTGTPRERLIGTDFASCFTDSERAQEAYRQAFSKGSVTDCPLTLRGPAGTLTEILCSLNVYKDPQGRVLGVFVAARDMTQLRKASEERARLAAIVDTSPDAIIGKSTAGVITSWNKGAERMFGYLPAEIIGLPITRLVPLHLQEEEREILDQLARGERVEPFETQRVRKSGEIFDVALTVSSVLDADGKVIAASKIARDITAQKQASRYARSLLEASIDPLVTISPAGKITDVNEGSIKITGLARDRLIGTDFCDYFTEPQKARVSYEQVFSNGFVTDYPLTIRHVDGRTTDVLYNASVYKDVRGNVLGVVAAARDVTAQRRAETEVAEERRKQLERVAELERFQKLTVGRELKMIELKKQIEDLKESHRAAGALR